MAGIAVGLMVKGRGANGWRGKVLAIGVKPDLRTYRLKMMSHGPADSGVTVWIDWGDSVLADKLAGGKKVAYGYPSNVVEVLEVVSS